ncbi:hypothetical protein BLOT_010010 [Blomia tropicalis]|nr:hypothetical protein BLOT_010010 [Blomia tropicalis]
MAIVSSSTDGVALNRAIDQYWQPCIVYVLVTSRPIPSCSNHISYGCVHKSIHRIERDVDGQHHINGQQLNSTPPPPL